MSEYSAPVQFIDLAAQQANIRDKIDAAIARVLDHGQYIMGPEVKQFEEDLKGFTGARHALTCANGTDALTLVMMAWGVGPGDAVFVPSFTYVASAETPAQLGATPFFVDVLEKVSILTLQALRKPLARQQSGRIASCCGYSGGFVRAAGGCRSHYQNRPCRGGIKVLVDGAQSFGAIEPWSARRHDGRCDNNQFLSGQAAWVLWRWWGGLYQG